MDLNHFDMANPFALIRKEDDVPIFVATMVGNFRKDTPLSKPENAKCRDALLQALVFFLYKETQRSEHNFANLVKLLAGAKIEENSTEYVPPLDIIFEDLAIKEPDHIAVKQYSLFKETEPMTAAVVLAELQTEMDALGWPALRVLRKK